MTRTNDITSRHLRPDPPDLTGLLAGEHHDPHSILGAHEYGDHTVIRACGRARRSRRRSSATSATRSATSRTALFAVALPFTDLIDYRLEVSYPAATAPDVHTVADPYRFLPTLGEIDLHLFAEGRHERLWEILGAHPRTFTHARRRGRRRVVRGVGAQRQGRQPDRRVQPLGRQRGAHAGAGLVGSLGVVLARLPDRRPVQVPRARRRRRRHRARRPVGVRHRGSAADGLAGDRRATTLGATTTGWPQRASSNPVFEPMSTYEVHLMSWRPGLSYRQLATSSPNTWWSRASPTSNCCPSPNTRSADPGATR